MRFSLILSFVLFPLVCSLNWTQTHKAAQRQSFRLCVALQTFIFHFLFFHEQFFSPPLALQAHIHQRLKDITILQFSLCIYLETPLFFFINFYRVFVVSVSLSCASFVVFCALNQKWQQDGNRKKCPTKLNGNTAKAPKMKTSYCIENNIQ